MASYLVSGAFLLTLASIMIGNFVYVTRLPIDQIGDIKERHPKYAAMYELLKTTSKSNLMYTSIYLARRTLLAIVLTLFPYS